MSGVGVGAGIRGSWGEAHRLTACRLITSPAPLEPSPAARLMLSACPPQGLSQGEPVVRWVCKDICLDSHLLATSCQPTSQRAF